MKPIVDGLETQFGDQLAFQRINANEGDGPAIMRAYRIQGHPTILLIDPQGQEVSRFIGPQSAEQLAEALQQALAAAMDQQVSATASATLPPSLRSMRLRLLWAAKFILGSVRSATAKTPKVNRTGNSLTLTVICRRPLTTTPATPGITPTGCSTRLSAMVSVTHSSRLTVH